MIVYNQVVHLPMELYYLCIDFVLQFIVEKYRNKLNQTKSNANQINSILCIYQYVGFCARNLHAI